MTLDDAIESFNGCASDKCCAILLRVLIEYHKDDMIGDETLYVYLERVAEWLADD